MMNLSIGQIIIVILLAPLVIGVAVKLLLSTGSCLLRVCIVALAIGALVYVVGFLVNASGHGFH